MKAWIGAVFIAAALAAGPAEAQTVTEAMPSTLQKAGAGKATDFSARRYHRRIYRPYYRPYYYARPYYYRPYPYYAPAPFVFGFGFGPGWW